MNPFIAFTLIAIYLIFLRWYKGGGKPLSTAEIEDYMARIGERQEASLRAFAEADDGRAFYNVNLVTLRAKAIYEDGRVFEGSSREANSKYGRAVLPELFKRASHPILLSSTLGVLGSEASNSAKWERINLVRYRSRRDLLDMVASQRWQENNAHKRAAVELTEIYPVAGFSSTLPALLVGMALIIIGLLSALL